MSTLKKIALLLRMPQWNKAIFVFLGVIYAHASGHIWSALLAAIAFCFTASGVYIYNDLQDLEEDKAHPKKSHRPLACGEVGVPFALSMMIFCLLLGLIMGFVVSQQLVVILVLYLFINFLYNHGLRNIPFLDVICIASGFMLRILAGTIGIGLSITWWLTITATLLSLYIALSKRWLEMQRGVEQSQRAVLRKYHPKVLNVLMMSTAMGCFVSYSLYTVYGHHELLYFLLTLPFCAFGLWRFAHLTLASRHNDDPVSLFLEDNISCINLLCFSSLTILALLQ